MFSIFVAFGEKNMARDLLNPRLQGRENGQRHWQQHGWTTFVGLRSIKVDSCCFLSPQSIEMFESLKSESSKFRSFLVLPKHFRDYQLRSLIHVWKISMRCSSNFGVPVSRWVPGGTQVFQVTPLSSVSDRLHPMTPHRSGGEWHSLLVEWSTLRARAQCVFLVDVMMKRSLDSFGFCCWFGSCCFLPLYKWHMAKWMHQKTWLVFFLYICIHHLQSAVTVLFSMNPWNNFDNKNQLEI